MFVSILQFLLPEVAVLLKNVIKNPASYTHLKGILTEIAADLATILAAM